MPVIHFETADATDRTQIGEALVRFAVAADRLERGAGDEGRYFLRHDDGCAVCGRRFAPGDPFYFDTDAGEVLCEDHGRERRDDERE